MPKHGKTRKKTGDVVLPSEELNAVFSSMAEGLLVVSNNGKVKAINQMGGIMLRIAPPEAVGMPVAKLLELYKKQPGVQNPQPWHLDDMFKLDITRVHTWDHVFCKTKDGKLFPITMIVTPLLKEANVQGAVVLFRDASEEVRADQAKSDFVAVASHQLQTPLTAIKLFAEMLETATEKQRREYLALLSSSVTRLIRLVNEMLNVSRLEAGSLSVKPVPVDLAEVIQSQLKELGPIIKNKNCTVIFNKPADSIDAVPVDTALLSQVLFNMVANSMRYSKKETCHVTIAIEANTEKQEYVLRIQDAGIGIEYDDQKRMFTKFFRADSARKLQSEGSGLGLYTVRMIIEAWGGAIWLSSKPGRGTTFYFTIPFAGMREHRGTRPIIHH
jgi:signal transduction histidine kinase